MTELELAEPEMAKPELEPQQELELEPRRELKLELGPRDLELARNLTKWGRP